MSIGHARISALDLQLQALKKAVCKKAFREDLRRAILPINTHASGIGACV